MRNLSKTTTQSHCVSVGESREELHSAKKKIVARLLTLDNKDESGIV